MQSERERERVQGLNFKLFLAKPVSTHFNFLCPTLGSGNKKVWMKILRVSRMKQINFKELIKYVRWSQTPIENTLKPASLLIAKAQQLQQREVLKVPHIFAFC